MFKMKIITKKMMKSVVMAAGLLTILTAGNLQAQQSTNMAAVPVLKTRADSVSYAFGLSIGKDLKQRGLEGVNPQAFAKAIEEVFSGESQALSDDQQGQLISMALTEAAEKRDAGALNAARSYMESNKTKEGVVVTASGLQYEIIEEGTGERPSLTDTVTVNYKGQLTNGKVFDSSYERGSPASFQLGRVITGWREGLQLMSVGGHYRFYIPYDLGYGTRGAGNDIPPYSVLIFEVELLGIKKGRAE